MALRAATPDTARNARRCTFLPDVTPGQNRLQNGIQIFSGGEPIYRNGVLVGAIGVSGDGTQQDDMIGFLGIDSAHTALGTISNAPTAIRADQLVINQGGGANRVLYVQCPVSPFLNSSHPRRLRRASKRMNLAASLAGVLGRLRQPAARARTKPIQRRAQTPRRSRSSRNRRRRPRRKDPTVIEGRQRPGQQKTYPDEIVQTNPGAVRAPPPEAFPTDQIPVPDRWRLAADLHLVNPRYFDPYNQNTLKGDRPLPGTNDWFLEVNAISDTVVEPFSIPTPINGIQSTAAARRAWASSGATNSLAVSQTFIAGFSLIKGSTAFKPPDLEFRLTLAFNLNYAQTPERTILSINPSNFPNRFDDFLGVQEAFVDYHIRNVSERYDFDSVRVGIQPFSTDFRGFLFQDDNLGVRFFGDRDDNRYQYNLAFFDRLDKDTNSGLNDLTKDIREDYVAVANLYRQDLPVPGFTSQVTVVYNANREGNEIIFDKNGFPVVPALIGDDRGRNYDVVYLGYNGDGHIDEFNLTASAYGDLREDRNNIFTNRPASISSYFFAAEPSYDWNWIRFRLSGLYASGDSKPHDNVETGFDAILENPQFAGADSSFWIRQSIPLIAGSAVVFLSSRNGILDDLRTSKTQGQSNFNNPGTILLGGGADFDVLPQLRISTNINHVSFANTAVVEALRQQGSISPDLGWDYSVATIWRPWQTQNIVFRASGAVLEPGSGFDRPVHHRRPRRPISTRSSSTWF